MRVGDQVSFEGWDDRVSGYIVGVAAEGTPWRTVVRQLRRIGYLHEVPAFVAPKMTDSLELIDNLIITVSITPHGRTCIILLTEDRVTGWVDQDSPDFLREWMR